MLQKSFKVVDDDKLKSILALFFASITPENFRKQRLALGWNEWIVLLLKLIDVSHTALKHEVFH